MFHHKKRGVHHCTGQEDCKKCRGTEGCDPFLQKVKIILKLQVTLHIHIFYL